MLVNILSAKTQFRYNPLDDATYARLSTDLIGVVAQKNQPVAASFQRGAIALSISAERSELHHYRAWEAYAAINDRAVIAPSLSMQFAMLDDTMIALTYKQYSGDGARIVGLSLHHKLSPPDFPVEFVTSLSYIQLFDGAPLRMNAVSFDVAALKNIGMFTPYAGIGGIRGRTEFQSEERMQFSTEMFRFFSGAEYRLQRIVLGAEVGVSLAQPYQRVSITYLF